MDSGVASCCKNHPGFCVYNSCRLLFSYNPVGITGSSVVADLQLNLLALCFLSSWQIVLMKQK